MTFKNIYRSSLSKFGIDQSIFYTTLSRGLQGFGGVANLFLISFFLKSDEQGYYYTFGSLIAIQIFFELGLNSIVIQYVAHEVAHLNYNENSGIYEGDFKYLSRVSHLLKLIKRTFLFLTVILFFIYIVLGLVFFGKYGQSTDLSWLYPWLLLSLSSSLFFFINPFIGYLQGLGYIVDVSKLFLTQQVIVTSVTSICLLSGLGLWTLGISNLTSVLIFFLFLIRKPIWNKLKYIYSVESTIKINYLIEIFPFQWKIAVSWISGYFIFQIFNPILFIYEGAVIAGKMGITLVALNGVSTISMSWLSTKVPLFSTLISNNKFKELDIVFSKTIRHQFTVNTLLLLVFNFGIFGLYFFDFKIAERFLSLKFTILLSLVTILNQIINSWATYLRCHKQEPFLLISVVGGVLCLISTITFGYLFGVSGIIYGYLFITMFIGFPWAYYVFNSKKIEWHS